MIQNLFTYPLFVDKNIKLSIDIKEECLNILNDTKISNEYKFGKTTWFNDHNIKKTNLINFKNYVLEQVKIFSDFLKLDINRSNFKISEIWISNMSQYGHHEYHSHVGAYLSGTFYVDVDLNSSNIRFFRPDYLSMKINNVIHFNDYNSKTWDIKPENGLLLMWQSSLPHSVLINESNKRISISFNIDII